MNSELEFRIRKWIAVQSAHPGRPDGRETVVDWLTALLAEIDQLRKEAAK